MRLGRVAVTVRLGVDGATGREGPSEAGPGERRSASHRSRRKDQAEHN